MVSSKWSHPFFHGRRWKPADGRVLSHPTIPASWFISLFHSALACHHFQSTVANILPHQPSSSPWLPPTSIYTTFPYFESFKNLFLSYKFSGSTLWCYLLHSWESFEKNCSNNLRVLTSPDTSTHAEFGFSTVLNPPSQDHPSLLIAVAILWDI